MTFYIENSRTDADYNLALEQALFDLSDPRHSYFMLWQNHNAIIIGKHQNTLEEINNAFVNDHSIAVVRRLSGGGAVYHDLGNLNFTFIAPSGSRNSLDFLYFCEPVRQALLSLGVPVEISGRNDMTVEGKKFSGNAQYIKNGRTMHHGTILYDSDLEMLSKALRPKDKIESSAIKSVRSGTANIRPYMKNDMDIQGFRAVLGNFMRSAHGTKDLVLTQEYLETAEQLRKNIYSQWNWNYGNSPPHTLRKTRRIEGCGKIDIFLDVGHEGIIKNAAIYGDFFSNRSPSELCSLLTGRHFEQNEIKTLLEKTGVGEYIHALTAEAFIDLLFS